MNPEKHSNEPLDAVEIINAERIPRISFRDETIDFDEQIGIEEQLFMEKPKATEEHIDIGVQKVIEEQTGDQKDIENQKNTEEEKDIEEEKMFKIEENIDNDINIHGKLIWNFPTK